MSLEDEEDEDRPVASSSGLTDEEYEEIKERYERGESGVTELAEEFGVSRTAIYKRLRNDNVKRGSKAAVVLAEKAVEKFIERKSDWIEETRFQGYQALRQVQLMARKVALDQMKASKPMGEIDDDMRAIGRLNKILCDNIVTSLKVLDADNHVDESNLPILSIEDLTDEDILHHHKLTGALDENATIEDLLGDALQETEE